MESLTPNRRTAREVQQNYAESLGFQQEILWDLLMREQENVLQKKIKELIPDQEKGQKAVIELRNTLFTSIWAQRKYSNGNSLTAIIFVLVTNQSNACDAKSSVKFSCHPVFRARKCSDKKGNTDNCCMLFIDEVGRVYQNWSAYKDNNVLPKGTMVAPKNGIYSFERSQVVLDACPTPAASATNTMLGVLDTTTTVGGLLSTAAPIASLCIVPVAAPILAGAAVMGLFSAGYMALRSGAQLVDRNQHEQSISLANREARSSWLAVGGGVVGLGAARATKTLVTAAAAGKEVSRITQFAVNGLGVSAIMLSGSGIVNGIFDLFLKRQDDEKISTLDLLQLGGSLVLFTHSVYNFRLASNLIAETQNGTIRQFRENLSNRQRKEFNRMYKETLRIRGEARGKMDVLRGVSEMPTKQQFNDLYKIRKDLNKRGVRPAFAPNGEGVILNNEVIVSTQELRGSVQHNVGPDILNTITQPIPETYQTGASDSTSTTRSRAPFLFMRPSAEVPHWVEKLNTALDGVRKFSACTVFVQGVWVELSDFGIKFFECITNVDEFAELIENMLNIFCEKGFRFIMNITRRIIESMLDELELTLHRCIGTQMILAKILSHISQKYRNITAEYLESKTIDILTAIRDYFLKSNPINEMFKWIKCNECNCFYQICRL